MLCEYHEAHSSPSADHVGIIMSPVVGSGQALALDCQRRAGELKCKYLRHWTGGSRFGMQRRVLHGPLGDTDRRLARLAHVQDHELIIGRFHRALLFFVSKHAALYVPPAFRRLLNESHWPESGVISAPSDYSCCPISHVYRSVRVRPCNRMMYSDKLGVADPR
ncbi:hypothetical protein DENSPDRAFT_297339 [Dentipellis sp. KUC8613]|nr:hypothetical protein DENSPDRAFT_297339 [Dentipellis sp. KUC8613]